MKWVGFIPLMRTLSQMLILYINCGRLNSGPNAMEECVTIMFFTRLFPVHEHIFNFRVV